jgi:tetratricopeptide (TPR) repeat protein
VALHSTSRDDRVRKLVNEIYSMLASEGLPSSCAVCGAACRTVRDLKIEDDGFALTVPSRVCSQCALQPPFPRRPLFPLEGNLSSMAASVLAHARAIVAGIKRAINRKEAAPNDRDRPTLDALIKTNPPYGLLLEAFPETTVSCAKTGQLREAGQFERQRFRGDAQVWQSYFYLTTPDELKQSVIPAVILFSYPEIIDARLKEVVDQARLREPLIIQIGAVLLPGRRWDFDCQVLTTSVHASTDRLKNQVINTLTSLPTWPVAYPVVLAVRRGFGKPPASRYQALQQPFQNWFARILLPDLTHAETARRFYEVTLPTEPLAVEVEDCVAIQRCLPNSAPLKMLHADLLSVLRRPDEALDIWDALIEEFPDEAEVVFRRIACLTRYGQLERAASECQKRISRCPDESAAYATLADLQVSMNLIAESLKTIDRALALKETAEFFRSRAGILAQLGRLDEAMSAVNTAVFQDRNCASAYMLRAKLHLQAKNYKEALDDLHEYHRCAGKSVESVKLQTMALRSLGCLADAEQAFRSAVQEAPRNLALKMELADFLAQTGRLESARQECDRIIESAPQLGVAYAMRSAVALEMSQFEEAIRDADLAIQHGARGPKTFLVRGAAKASLGRLEEGLKDFDACIETAPQYALGLYHRGRLYKQREAYSLAVADLTAALDIAPGWAEALVERGYAFLGQEEHSEARQDFEQAIKLSPSLSEAYAGRGIMNLIDGKKSAALADLNKAIVLDPNNLRGRMQRAGLLLEQLESGLAKEDLDEILAARPDFEPALWQRAHLQLQLGQFADAKRDFDRLIEINPEVPQSFVGRSVALELSGDAVTAEADREEARQLAPFSSEQLTLSQNLLVASVADRNEDFEKVIEVTTKIISEHPEPVWDAYRLRGHANWYAENFVEALDDYSQILEHADEPTRHDFSAYGQILGELGDFERGLESLDRSVAIAREKDDLVGLAFSLSGRGRALAGLGRLDEAEEAFRESLKLRPDNAWLHFHRGMMYVEQKKLSQALACFELALCVESPKLPPGKRRRAAGFIKTLRGGSPGVQQPSTMG